jgi:hypothetical protein
VCAPTKQGDMLTVAELLVEFHLMERLLGLRAKSVRASLPVAEGVRLQSRHGSCITLRYAYIVSTQTRNPQEYTQNTTEVQYQELGWRDPRRPKNIRKVQIYVDRRDCYFERFHRLKLEKRQSFCEWICLHVRWKRERRENLLRSIL